MAASKAPTANTTTNVSSTSTSTSSTTTDNIEHNFHELCRSCGKTNAELYDLFQTTNSPFSTSSTTCYTHLNNCNFTSSRTSSAATAANNQPSTSTKATSTAAAGCTKSTTRDCLTTFDSVAATAKATAKGQSNMDNILQEMQIWQLSIKCNDGLPQRICAKCTAQFYMIHKFRRKCLKVQTQLRALHEEYEQQQQQQQPQQHKFYERQQQQNEKNVTVKEEATTIEATSTPTTAETNAKAASRLVEAVKPPAVMHKVNDLVNDNYGPTEQEQENEIEQQLQQQQQQQEKEKVKEKVKANVDNTNIKSSAASSVSFEANTGNTNDFIAPTRAKTSALWDNVEKTMPQKSEANEPTPTSSPPSPPTSPPTSTVLNDKTFEAPIKEHCCVVTTGPGLLKQLKDEKKPLLKPSVLDTKRSPPLTFKQPSEQICDNEMLNATKKFRFDHGVLIDNHRNPFKTQTKQSLFTQITKTKDLSSSGSANSSPLTKTNDKNVSFNFIISPAGCSGAAVGLTKLSTENLFITKAALKAYTIPPATSGEQTKNRDHQKPITNSEAINNNNNNHNNSSSSSSNNDDNNNNNNAHINTIYTSNRCDNRNQQLNDSTCSSTSNTTPTTSSFSSTSSRCCSKAKQKRFKKNSKTKIIKYASHNKRSGHCYKTNANVFSETATAKMARTIQSYGKYDGIESAEMAGVVVKRRKPDKHKLKRLKQKNKTTSTTTTAATLSSTSLRAAQQTRRRRRKKHYLQNFKICHKKSIQIEDEMSNTTVSTTSLASTAFTATSSSASSPSSSSSSSSVSSSAAISSTSLHYLRATTPAVVDLVRKRNITKKGCSSADSLSSTLKTCSKMWKTKAAMKANDMPVNVKHDDDDGDQPTGNKPHITLPYIVTNTTKTTAPNGSISSSSPAATSATTTSTSSATILLSKSLTEIQKGSKTPSDENVSDQHDNHNKVTMPSASAAVKQDKDINYASKIAANLKTEEAVQKQLNTAAQQPTDNNVAEIIIATVENDFADMESNNLGINKEEQQNPQQKHIKSSSPPATRKGSMKLIIQRKRGKRFKCRPKSEDEICHDKQQSYHQMQQHQSYKIKRKRKKSNSNLKCKLDNRSFQALDGSNNNKDPATSQCLNLAVKGKEGGEQEQDQEQKVVVAEPLSATKFQENNNTIVFNNTGEDENKENPSIPPTNSYDFDSDSNVSVYRDPLLLRNDTLEEDTHVTDFVKIPLSIQNECSKETYKLYKEKAQLDSPKKLIVRVPLTSLTQDFKRLHLNKDEPDNNSEANKNELSINGTAVTADNNLNSTEIQTENVETLKVITHTEIKDLIDEQQDCNQLNTSGSQSDFMGFSQSTDTSSVNSAEIIRYIEPPLCSASSKITDFINDFQNNCIDSSEIEESCDIIIPTLGPHITQELSDEIRDVEDTLNGIINEMHDKDMYTPKSAETDEFFNHSLYSPLTDAPTTPSQSFYAESPCTINSNPMSVSPFIHHNMDYNAMTPQSQHSGMGFGSSSSCMGGGGSTGPHTSIYSEHYPSYNECNEETTQSELIGFQNDIPCFENIEVANVNNNQLEMPSDANEHDQSVEGGEEDEEEEEDMSNTVLETNNMASHVDNELTPLIEQFVHTQNEAQPATEQFVPNQANDMPDEPLPPNVPTITEHIQQPKHFPFTNANYHQQINSTPTFHVQTAVNPLVSRATTTQPHYIVTNTNQGQIIITNPTQLNSQAREQIVPAFKPHSNNLQFVTLGQAMKTAQPTSTNQLLNNNTTGHQWTTTTVTNAPSFNQRPVLTHNNATTTYFINANGELYQANIPANNLSNPSPVNHQTTIFVPPNTNQAFGKNRLDNTVQTIQQQQHPAQQRPPPQNNNASSQYIMLVNNLNGSPQYYATTPANNINPTVSPGPQNISTPTVLIQPAQLNPNNPSTSNNVQTNNMMKSESTVTGTGTGTATKSSHIPITPAREPREDLTMRQMINQQLQKQIKQRQLQLLQPRSPNVAQKINLICRFCHKRPKFTNNVDYSNHIISTHPAEKPYNCPNCPTHFSRRSDRQMHVAQVHGARYQCAQCGLSFCAQRTLDFHLQKYHANMGRYEQLAHLQQQQQKQQQNSTSSSTTTAATYQLLQHNQQQRLVRIEDVHVQVTDEHKKKRSIDLPFGNAGGDCGADIQASQSFNEVEMLSHTNGHLQQQQQQQQQQRQQKSRKLCCPDCNGDNDDCCGGGDSDQKHDQNDINSRYGIQQAAANSNLQNTGNESVNNHPQQHQQQQQQQPQHVTIPSPEQTEPDSTTTLRHFRKRQLCEISTSFTASSPSSSSSSLSSSSSSSIFSLHNNTGNTNNNGGSNDHHNSPDNVLAGDGGGEQIVVERSLRGSHNCLLCEESFTNEIALRKHHQLAHGAATQSLMSSCSSAAISSMPLVCTICKRGFRMRNALQRHMETHDAEGRPYECNICQVRFPRPSQLTLHKLTVHKFENPNACDECGKKFGTESAMKAHAIEHEKAAAVAYATTSEASTSSSFSKTATSSIQAQLPSHIHEGTITNTTTTTTTSTNNDEPNRNLQSTCTLDEDFSASSIHVNDSENVSVRESGNHVT